MRKSSQLLDFTSLVCQSSSNLVQTTEQRSVNQELMLFHELKFPPLLLLFILSNGHTLLLLWSICCKININSGEFWSPYMRYSGSWRWKISADICHQAPGLISRMTWLQCCTCFQLKVWEIRLFPTFVSLFFSVNGVEDRELTLHSSIASILWSADSWKSGNGKCLSIHLTLLGLKGHIYLTHCTEEKWVRTSPNLQFMYFM